MLPIFAEFIVFLSIFRIAQHFIRLIDLFKFPFSFFVIRVQIRMIFSGKLAVSFFDFLLTGRFIHPQNFVIIYKFHGLKKSSFLQSKLLKKRTPIQHSSEQALQVCIEWSLSNDKNQSNFIKSPSYSQTH